MAGTGYNGPPAGHAPSQGRESCAAFCPRADTVSGSPDFTDCPSVHAELNALLYSDRHARKGGTIYITRDPCWSCAQAVAASGVSRVVWPYKEEWMVSDRSKLVREYLFSCGIHWVALT